MDFRNCLDAQDLVENLNAEVDNLEFRLGLD